MKAKPVLAWCLRGHYGNLVPSCTGFTRAGVVRTVVGDDAELWKRMHKQGCRVVRCEIREARAPRSGKAKGRKVKRGS